ncbi:MAG: KpsF/GutQ family sugar-phosphate isomerase [Flavobacteriales bacterium]
MSNTDDTILHRALITLRMEGDAIHRLATLLDNSFVEVIHLIINAKGRLILTGVGKSADVGRKIVATLNSTGSPALFVHAGDALHGDLGVIQSGDVVLCLSKSGRSAEIMALVPLLKQNGHPIIGVTGVIDSPLAMQSDHVLLAGIDPEACPYDLAPTTSTAVQMALGDAIAMCLMEARGFKAEDFAKFHPGGTLGKKLTVTLNDLIDQERSPQVNPESTLQEVLMSMTEGRYGATVVIENTQIVGIVTDGDLRRALESGNTSKASEMMSANPLIKSHKTLAAKSAAAIQDLGISQVIVTGDDNEYLGLVHLHDLIKEGITSNK